MMKKFSLIMMFVALLGATSCGSLTSATDATAVASGAACGRALIALNNSKKAGTLALTNPTDITNMLAVITAYNSLKANKENSNYKKSFATGLVTGGGGIINATTATTLTNMLLNSTGLNGVNSNNIASTATTLTTMGQLLGAIK